MSTRAAAQQGPWGVPLALIIIGAWAGHLAWVLTADGLSWASPVTWLHIVLQAHLCTGLFITGHDAMHGTVHRRRWVNTAVGTVACFLFAGLSYRRLVVNHRAHHADPTGESDPGLLHPVPLLLAVAGHLHGPLHHVPQILVMAAKFNLLKWLGVAAVAPVGLLGGARRCWARSSSSTSAPTCPTAGPETPDMAPHHARTQPRNHLWALLSCYFFGYHWEHHESPSHPMVGPVADEGGSGPCLDPGLPGRGRHPVGQGSTSCRARRNRLRAGA